MVTYRSPRGCSSAGRAPRSQRGSRRFESAHLHRYFSWSKAIFVTCCILLLSVHRAFIARARHEPAAKTIRCGLVSLRHSLSVKSQRQSRIGVAHANLRCLHVCPILHERRRHRAPKVVKAQIRKTCRLTRGRPNTIAPVCVTEGSSFGRDEHERVAIGLGQAPPAEVVRQQFPQWRWQRNGPARGSRLRCIEYRAPLGISRDGLVDRHGTAA